jgi:hypothetical protein
MHSSSQRSSQSAIFLFWLFSQSSGWKGTEIFFAQGVRPAPGGTESAGTTRIQERLLGFRKAPLPDLLSKNRIPVPIRITKSFSDPNR